MDKLSSISEYFCRLCDWTRSIFHQSKPSSCTVLFSQRSIWDPKVGQLFGKTVASWKLEFEIRHKMFVFAQTSNWGSLNATSLCLKSKTMNQAFYLNLPAFSEKRYPFQWASGIPTWLRLMHLVSIETAADPTCNLERSPHFCTKAHIVFSFCSIKQQ